MKKVRLENWSVNFYPQDPYTAPEMRHPVLCGEVYYHPNFENGQKITTSTIVRINKKSVKTYSGTIYYLGNVNPNYEKKYPNAKERFFKNAPKTIYPPRKIKN